MTTIAATLFATGSSGLGSALERVVGRLGPLTVAGVSVPVVEVSSALATLLDLPVGNLALKGWQHHRDVARACERTSAQPGTREVLRLLEHKIVSHQSPVIEVAAGGASTVLLELDLDIEIEASGVELVIEHGAIVETRPGPAVARAKLSASGVVLAEHEFQPVDLRL